MRKHRSPSSDDLARRTAQRGLAEVPVVRAQRAPATAEELPPSDWFRTLNRKKLEKMRYEIVRASRRTLNGLLADACDAEDIAQDIATDVLAGKYDATRLTQDKIVPWAITVAQGCARNRWRRAQRCAALQDDQQDRRRGDPATHAVCVCLRDHLRTALDRLTQKERTCIVLHDHEGYKVSDIAKNLGIKEDAVKQRLTRGRRKIRKLLRHWNPSALE